MTRLNISEVDPDPVLAQALDVIVGESRVGGAQRSGPNNSIAGVIDTVQASTLPNPVVLDLIAHAANGELQLASWSITATEPFAAQLAAAIQPGMLAAVRLLGCYTADTQPGMDALRHLKATLGVPVLGTSNMIFASDFDAAGFHTDAVLIEVDDLPSAAAPLSNAKLEQGFARFPLVDSIADLHANLLDESREEAEKLTSHFRGRPKPLISAIPIGTVFSLGTTVLRTAPGLLAIPDREWLYPSTTPGMFHRVTLLFGGRLIRVYPNAHPKGVLFHRAAALI
jgi:hypothetical protein